MLEAILKLGVVYIGAIVITNIAFFSLMVWAIIYTYKKVR